MGNFCGWSGANLGADTSQQIIRSMLKATGSTDNAKSDINHDTSGVLGTSEGLYKTSYTHQDDVSIAITGSPVWDNKELSETAAQQGMAVALIKAYHTFGKDLLSRLHGPFALVVQDSDQTLIAIDRIGIHSLSYSLQNGAFVFSTSTKSVTRHPNITREIDPQAIFNYIYFHDIPSPRDYFQEYRKAITCTVYSV